VLNNTGKNVLLLEDELVIGKVVRRALSVDGYHVDIAENGQIAKDKIDSDNYYDILIFDIRTPVINGMQLYEYLEKEHPELSKKVVFATGDYVNSTTRKFLEKANRPFLAKPYTPVQIRGIIDQVLGAGLTAAGKN
jgi:CheY-like chemotaxis protein